MKYVYHRTWFHWKLNLFMHLYNQNFVEHGHSKVLGVEELTGAGSLSTVWSIFKEKGEVEESYANSSLKLL